MSRSLEAWQIATHCLCTLCLSGERQHDARRADSQRDTRAGAQAPTNAGTQVMQHRAPEFKGERNDSDWSYQGDALNISCSPGH